MQVLITELGNYSPDEGHHLLHDVFAEGDDNKEFLWEGKEQSERAWSPGKAQTMLGGHFVLLPKQLLPSFPSSPLYFPLERGRRLKKKKKSS